VISFFQNPFFFRVNPVIKWAQNNTHILLNIKLSHRHDAPGCLDVTNESLVFKDNQVNYTASGISAGVPLYFEMFLVLDKPIISSLSSWQKESVGTFSVTLKKKKNGLWKKVVESKEQIGQHQIQIWWEMRSQFKKSFDKHIDMLDDEEETETESKVSLSFL
jgi:hypothetical protein